MAPFDTYNPGGSGGNYNSAPDPRKSNNLPNETGGVKRSPSALGRVIRFVFGAVKSYLIFVGLSVTILPILIVLLVSKHSATQSSEHAPELPVANGQPGVVRLVLDAELSERSPDISQQIVERFFGHHPGIYIPDLRRTLRKLAKNPNVLGLHLDLSLMSGGEAELGELRRALGEFKESGKKVHIFAADIDDAVLFVGSIADRLVMPPSGSVIIPGPLFQLTYFGEALRKLGVSVEVIRHGRFKSAFEPFVNNEPSPESLEMYRAMEKSLRNHLVQVVATGRQKSESEVASWFVKSIFTGQEALTAGIVDELIYLTESEDGMSATLSGTGVVGIEELESHLDSLADDALNKAAVGAKDSGVALIEAVGEIAMAIDEGPESSAITPAMIEELRWAAEAKEVKAVVMRVSSPGGSAVASDLIWREVKRLAATKPVVVSMGNYAASGGYYISAPASKIFAEPSTITGSIGVIGMLPKVPEFKQKYGVSFHVVTQSARERLFNFGASSTDEDKKLFSNSIDAMYSEFISKVAEGRSLKVEDVDRIAQGRVYTGLEAKGLGLVDELGGLQEAFQSAKELGGLDPSNLYPVYRYEGDDMSFARCFRSPADMARCFSQGSGTMGRIAAGFTTLLGQRAPFSNIAHLPADAILDERAQRRLRRFVAIARRDHVLAVWPGILNVEQP